jgi:hypothetical protein
MTTPDTKTKNSDSHNNAPPDRGCVEPKIEGCGPSLDRPPSLDRSASSPPESHPPTFVNPINPPTRESTHPSAALLPKSALDRKFRATSFAAKLTEQQRATLTLWLIDEKLTIDSIRKKVAAPPPEGFGLEVQPTTLRRLRALVRNSAYSGWFSESMDTACDLFDNPDTAQAAPLREALTLMLYSGAIAAAKKQAEPSTIDKLVTTINRLERRHLRSHEPRAPLTTRHHVELSVVPANGSPEPAPKIINITATPLTTIDKAH